MNERQVDKELAELTAARIRRIRQREDRRAIKNHARDNAKGKLKIRSRTSGPLGRALNHKKPKNFTRRNPSFTNPMASLGYSDEQYKVFKKTGKTKAQQEGK